VVDDYTAGIDVDFAVSHVDDFYQGVLLGIEQVTKAQDQVQRNYVNFGELKDPPSLGMAIVKGVLGAVMGTVPGWSLIQNGLETGMFVSELGRLKLELEETPIPGITFEEEKRRGPSAEIKEKAKKRVEYGKTAWESGKEVFEKVTEALEKGVEARELEEKEVEKAGLGLERIAEWTKASGAAQREQAKVKEWIRKAAAEQKLRGKMYAAVRERLGPVPFVDDTPPEPLIKKYELELYRMKYKKTAAYVRTIHYYAFSEDEPSKPMLRVAGGLSQATRRRIAYCADVTGTDDETMAKVLGIETTTESKLTTFVAYPGVEARPE
jgi:hypothetical protein